LNICQLPAAELARLLRVKAISARDVVSAHLSRIEAVNPKVNAIVTLTAEEAMEHARGADQRLARGEPVGLLHGLPIAHKDLQETRGIRTTFGSPIFRDYVPRQDSPTVERLKRAGAITVGKTNTPEFGAGSQTFNPVFGATLNPYDLTKTCGGSSGGAAVALACGMLPIADGTDMGGSLRNPAAFCGVVGMRPAVRVEPGSKRLASWELLSVDGPMARTAADVALLLAAMAGPTIAIPGIPDLPAGPAIPAWPALAALERDFRGSRIAWSIQFGQLPFDAHMLAVVDAARPVFESLGCTVEEASADFSGADKVFKTLRAQAFVNVRGDIVKRHRALVKETILDEIDRGERLTTADVDLAERGRVDLRRRVCRFMERYAFFVLPTTQVPPFDVSDPFVREINGAPMTSYIDWMRSCYYVSTIGYPAVSVPCGFTSDGLPVGLQIVGRDGDDWGVLQLAHAFERARGPFPAPQL
jgi:amidase